MKNNYFLIGVILIAALLLVILVWGLPKASVQPSSMPAIGKPLADFELTTSKGDPIKLSDLRGKAVVLNFWATWCGPCREEMPLLQKAQDLYPDRLKVVAVNMGEAPSAVKEFVSSNQLSIIMVMDSKQSTSNLYYIVALPTTFFLDENGILRGEQIGGLNSLTLSSNLKILGLTQ